MAKTIKDIIETGKRYAEIDVEAGLVRRVHSTPLRSDEDGRAQNMTIPIPEGHILVEAPGSLGMLSNRPIKGIESFETAVKDAKKAASDAAKKAPKTGE